MRLAELGARSCGIHYEGNTVFDTPEQSLAEARQLLRLRERRWPDRSDFVLTFKYISPQASLLAASNVKAREEIETKVEDASAMRSILQGLGYVATASYEKFRESWTLPWPVPDGKSVSCHVDLDLLPFCNAAEIEAPPALINDIADALELDKLKISLNTYHELHQQWRSRNGFAPAVDIMFKEREKRRIFSSLHLPF